MQAGACGRLRGADNKVQILDLVEPTPHSPLQVHELPTATETNDHRLSVPDERTKGQ